MIKKQFSFKSQEEVIFDGKKFVDRESARTAFNDFVTSDDKEYNVLMYYGIGGVGKSMLLAENEQSFQQLFPDSILFSVDLHDAGKRTIDSTLLEFVENCSDKKVKFEAFNLAYTFILAKNMLEKNTTETRVLLTMISIFSLKYWVCLTMELLKL